MTSAVKRNYEDRLSVGVQLEDELIDEPAAVSNIALPPCLQSFLGVGGGAGTIIFLRIATPLLD